MRIPGRKYDRLLQWTVAAFSALLSMELGAFLYIHTLMERYPLLFQVPAANLLRRHASPELNHYISCASGFICHHPELGWWHQPGRAGNLGYGPISADDTGSRIIPGAQGPVLLATYGDSFTEGTEVSDDSTWQAFLARNHGFKVQNFGVMGFGPDQALLYFEKNLAKGGHPPVAVLGLISESPSRLMNAFRPFYTYPIIDTALGLKPVLVKKGSGYALWNPIPPDPTDPKQLERSIESVEPFDEFFRLRANRGVFPYLFSMVAFLHRQGFRPRFEWPGATPEALRRVGWVLDRFCDEARARGIIPVLLMMPLSQRELEMDRVPGYGSIAGLVRAQSARDLIVVDVVKEWREEASGRPSRATKSYEPFLRKTHPSRQGNQLIADLFARALCRSDKIKFHPAIAGRLCEKISN